MIHHMKTKVELKRRRHKMRYYNDCFTGTDAVDVILHYLLSDRDTFSSDLSREKAVKVRSFKIIIINGQLIWTISVINIIIIIISIDTFPRSDDRFSQ